MLACVSKARCPHPNPLPEGEGARQRRVHGGGRCALGRPLSHRRAPQRRTDQGRACLSEASLRGPRPARGAAAKPEGPVTSAGTGHTARLRTRHTHRPAHAQRPARRYSGASLETARLVPLLRKTAFTPIPPPNPHCRRAASSPSSGPAPTGLRGYDRWRMALLTAVDRRPSRRCCSPCSGASSTGWPQVEPARLWAERGDTLLLLGGGAGRQHRGRRRCRRSSSTRRWRSTSRCGCAGTSTG